MTRLKNHSFKSDEMSTVLQCVVCQCLHNGGEARSLFSIMDQKGTFLENRPLKLKQPQDKCDREDFQINIGPKEQHHSWSNIKTHVAIARLKMVHQN